MNTVKKYFFSIVGASSLIPTSFAEINPGLDKVDEGLQGVGDTDPIASIQSFIVTLLTLLGLVMVGMALWGGWQILTSGSEDAGKEAGKKIIINAIIGIVVIFFAWTIANLVFGILRWEIFG